MSKLTDADKEFLWALVSSGPTPDNLLEEFMKFKAAPDPDAEKESTKPAKTNGRS